MIRQNLLDAQIEIHNLEVRLVKRTAQRDKARQAAAQTHDLMRQISHCRINNQTGAVLDMIDHYIHQHYRVYPSRDRTTTGAAT